MFSLQLLLCEDMQGNKFMLKPCNSNGTGWNPQEVLFLMFWLFSIISLSNNEIQQ